MPLPRFSLLKLTQHLNRSLSRSPTFCTLAQLPKAQAQTQKLTIIADSLLSLSPIERHDYNVLFNYKLALNRYASPSAGLVSGPSSGGGGGGASIEAKVEKTTWDIKLEKFDAAAKIKIIKEVRTFTSLGLKEAKELVEKAPCVLKSGVGKDDGEGIVEKLKGLGATVVLE